MHCHWDFSWAYRPLKCLIWPSTTPTVAYLEIHCHFSAEVKVKVIRCCDAAHAIALSPKHGLTKQFMKRFCKCNALRCVHWSSKIQKNKTINRSVRQQQQPAWVKWLGSITLLGTTALVYLLPAWQLRENCAWYAAVCNFVVWLVQRYRLAYT